MITINIDKAKTIAHDLRRSARSEEFKPYDEIISKQIPGIAFQDAEASRQLIREKYATMQVAIDQSTNVQELKTVLQGI